MIFTSRDPHSQPPYSAGIQCYCCGEHRAKQVKAPIDGIRCLACGCLYKRGGPKTVAIQNTIDHYEHVDPHISISNAKFATYRETLNRLKELKRTESKRLLDIGCGFGYFLEEADGCGWETYGVELSPQAAAISESKIGKGRVVSGAFQSALFNENFFDVVTLWDVLDMMDDPKGAIREIHRILRKDGLVFIRVRNATSQMILYHAGRLMKPVSQLFGIKNLYVFHKYAFTLKSLTAILQAYGFTVVDSGNAQFTQGDPYGHFKQPEILRSGKQIASVISTSIYRIGNRQIALNPSIFVLCRKM